MRRSRSALLTLWLFALLLAVAAPAAFAGECPLSGTSYAPAYASPIGLPRCIGTINKWTPCEVCALSEAVFTEQDAYTQSYYPPPGKTELQPRATFTQGATTLHVDGFFDGLTTDPNNPNKAIFRIRFTPTTDSGMINFSTDSSDPGLRVTGSITAGAASGKGFLRREPASNELPPGSPPVNPRTFVWDNGNHPFVWGQTLYQIVEHARAGPDDRWQTAITRSAFYGMNKVRLLVSPWGPDLRPPAADSKAFQKIGDNLNRDLLDTGHWQALDRVTSFLKGQGMIEDLILFHDGDETTKPYGTEIQNRRYTRYTVARYAAFPNVIWTLANEYQNITGPSPANNDPWTDLGCLIRGGCKNYPGADPWFANGAFLRPLSIQNNINSANANYPCFDFFLAKWPAHVSLQTRRNDATTEAEAGSAILKNSINRSTCPGSSSAAPQLPVINDEYYYIGQRPNDLGFDRLRHREASWAIAANGGFGSTGDLQGPTNPDCKHGADNNPDYRCSPTLYTVWVEDQTEIDAYGDLSSLIKFFTINLNGLWPQMVATTRLSRYDSTRVYGMEGPGPNPKQYVVYTVRDAGGAKAKFNMKVPAGRYSYTFYDAKTLSAQAAQEKIVNSGTRASLFMSLKNSAWTDFVARITPYVGDFEPDDTAWVWDELPAGAITAGDAEGWTWIDDEPAAMSDSLAHTSNLVAGMHQHYFTGASETLSLSTGDFLYAWVYLDPLSPPSEVMLQWNDGTWEHRAYWGANQLGWGTDGTNSRRYMGPLPATDQWVRLQVPASAVGLEGQTLNGMAFTLFGGKATWDDAGKSAPQCDASAISQQPLSQTIIPGASATLSVAVSGHGPFQYQFYQAPVGVYQNPIGISTATINTGPLYTTKQYWAEVIDNCSGTFLRSEAATITVQCTAAPVITQQPTSRVTTPGQWTILSVSATQGVSYQWYQGNSPSTANPISGATYPTLSVAPQSTTSYWVRVTNGCGTADSVTATVCVLPAITAQPTPRTINPGQSTTLTVTAINAATYQWYVGTASSTTTPTGGNSSSLPVSPMTTTSYWVRITNTCGSVDSTTVTVTVVPPPPPQITRIQSKSTLANSQNGITANWPQPTQPGTFLVAVISGLKDPAQLQWTAPAGWQLAVVEEWTNVKLAIYYLPNNAGARTSETFTVQQGYHDMTLYLFEYSGMMAVNPLDRAGSSGDFTNNGYVQTGFTANTGQPKELVITGLSTYTQTEFNVTPADGYTEVYDQSMLYHLTTAMYEKITTSIGSYGHGATVSVPAEWAGVVATFRAANTN